MDRKYFQYPHKVFNTNILYYFYPRKVAICQHLCPQIRLTVDLGHLVTIFTHAKGSFWSLNTESDGWKSRGGENSSFLFFPFTAHAHRRVVGSCARQNVREARFIPLPPGGEGCALPRTEFDSNCCPVRQRHSPRSPGDCSPPTTTSRSIITTSSTILISSTSPQRRFGRFSLPLFWPTSRRFSAALRGSVR